MEDWKVYYETELACIHIKGNKLMFQCIDGIAMATFNNQNELLCCAHIWIMAAEELLK